MKLVVRFVIKFMVSGFMYFNLGRYMLVTENS